MPFNFPAPLPVRRFADGLSYPLNLTSDNRNYFTRIEFIRYRPAIGGIVESTGNFVRDVASFISSGATSMVPEEFLDPTRNLQFGSLANMGDPIGQRISLPIPKKINEMNMMNWGEVSLTGTILSGIRAGAVTAGYIAGGQRGAMTAGNVFDVGRSIATVGSAIVGVQLNPFILQYFQRPSFREFSFTWTLAPRNRKESEQINKIINQIKAAQAPRKAAGGFLMEYPDLAIVQFFPNDEFQIKLKECVIVGVNVDYTPAGPSYINGTSAPTMVNLTVHLKETKLWWSEEWGGASGTVEAVQRPAENNSDGSRPPTTEPNPLPDYGEGDGAIYGPGGLTG